VKSNDWSEINVNDGLFFAAAFPQKPATRFAAFFYEIVGN